MTLLLPTSLPFGRLRVDEVWLEFDGPRLFVARNTLGHAFVFNAIDETDTAIEYLAVPLSELRLRMIRSGGLALRAAFTAPEEEYVFAVSADYSDQVVGVTQLAPADLTEQQLPAADARLSIPTDTLTEFDPDDLPLRARSEGRTLVAIRLNPPTLVRSEYPARSLSIVLRSVQALADALVQEDAGKPTKRGGLPRQVLEDAELALVDLQAASFVAVLAPSRSSRSTPTVPSLGLEMPTVLRALEKMHAVLVAAASSQASATSLREAASEMGVRTLAKVRELLEAGVDQQTSLSLYIAPPEAEMRAVVVSTAAASTALLVLSTFDELEDQFELRNARLVGVNLRTARFELHDPEVEPGRFVGRIAESARAEIEGLPTGEAHRYQATLNSSTTVSELSDELKISYSLISIRRVEPGGS